MKIALDFDKTFTADPDFWMRFIYMVEEFGHSVYIVTARDEHNDGIRWQSVGLHFAPCEVIWCDGRPKREVVKGIDIWIDDDPYGIIHGTQMKSPDDLKAWREQDEHRGSSEVPHGRSRGFGQVADTTRSEDGRDAPHGKPAWGQSRADARKHANFGV